MVKGWGLCPWSTHVPMHFLLWPAGLAPTLTFSVHSPHTQACQKSTTTSPLPSNHFSCPLYRHPKLSKTSSKLWYFQQAPNQIHKSLMCQRSCGRFWPRANPRLQAQVLGQWMPDSAADSKSSYVPSRQDPGIPKCIRLIQRHMDDA
jgi:hypothetical protein